MKPKSDSRFFEVVAAQRKKWDEIAGQAIRSRAQQVSHHSQAVARAVSDLAARDAVAQHTMVGQPDPPERQRIIGSFNNGAKKAFPKRQVILLSGDGGLSMSLDRGSGEKSRSRSRYSTMVRSASSNWR